MKTKSFLLRISLWSALIVLLAGFAVPAVSQASSITFNLTSDHCTGGCGTAPFGSVTLNDNGGANVTVTVHLNSPNAFVKTGALDSMAFEFSGVGVVLGDIVNITNADKTLTAAAGPFTQGSVGTFGFGITCAACGNGGGDTNRFSSDIVFTVNNATIADLTHPNANGNVFAADIISISALGGTGNTGAIDATTPVPEPSTILLYGLGLTMLLVGQKWRKTRETNNLN